MKTLKGIFSILYVLILCIIAMSNNCQAGKVLPLITAEQSCSPLSVVTVTVHLTSDCTAMQNCQFEVLVFDITDCSVDTQPIARQDFVYGYDNIFSNLTINNAYVRVCIRKKTGTTCPYEFYAPKCSCAATSSPSMYFSLDICNP